MTAKALRLSIQRESSEIIHEMPTLGTKKTHRAVDNLPLFGVVRAKSELDHEMSWKK